MTENRRQMTEFRLRIVEFGLRKSEKVGY